MSGAEQQDDDLPMMSPQQAQAAGAVMDEVLPVMSPEQARAAGAVNVEPAVPVGDAYGAHLGGQVTIDQAEVVRAIEDHAASSSELIGALVEAIQANTAAVLAQTNVLAAPKSLVMQDGKPVGVKVNLGPSIH